MRCKPGDLAVRVRVSDGAGAKTVGHVYVCLKLIPLAVNALSGEQVLAVWHVERNGITRTPRGNRMGVPDCDLQPLGNPGGDARDQTLDWLPVPSRETEHT